MASRTAQQASGALGEDRALAYLLEQGLKLIARNVLLNPGRSQRSGELDLVMTEGATVVFVEVRARGSSLGATQFGGAIASLSPQKIARLTRAAQTWLQRDKVYRHHPPLCRIDAILIDGDQPLQWLKNITG